MSEEARPLEWTPEHVSRFWNNWSETQDLRDQYFTFQIGAEIATFMSEVRDVNGLRILDYGCGPGYLIERLLERGARVAAADFSTVSVAVVNERYAGHPRWDGAVQAEDGSVSVKEGSFDFITCIETIEHMFEEPRRRLLNEFMRLLKPGGHVLFTTPNEEDLADNSIYCPNCGASFHNMQHVCSWSAESLSAFLQVAGFKVEFCGGVDLRRWGRRPRRGLLDTSPRDAIRALRDLVQGGLDKVFDTLAPRQFPLGRAFRRRLSTPQPVHLVAIATKA